MNLYSNLIVQPHTRLPATGDLQFNLGDRFQPANANFPLDYQPPRQNYPPNQVRENVAPQRYQPRVNGNWVEIRIDRLDNLKGHHKKVKVSAPKFDGIMDPNAFSNWLVAIKEFFYWYVMIESEQIQFAIMKLTNSTKMY